MDSEEEHLSDGVHPRVASTRLGPLDIAILEMLWLNLRDLAEDDTREHGLTVAEVGTGLAARGFERTRADLQRHHLNKLMARGLITARKSTKKAASPVTSSGEDFLSKKPDKDAKAKKPGGDKPQIYRLDQNRIITWPSTAFMLVRLWKAPLQAIERPDFVAKMLEEKLLSSSSTSKVADESAISRQLDTCIAWGYLEYVNQTVLKPGPRLEDELDYLRFVARQIGVPTT